MFLNLFLTEGFDALGVFLVIVTEERAVENFAFGALVLVLVGLTNLTLNFVWRANGWPKCLEGFRHDCLLS